MISSSRLDTGLELLTRQWLVEAIALYQQHISPKKGFSCPHRLLYGGASCSESVKQVLQHHALQPALPLIYDRFQACAAARRTLQATSSSGCVVIPCCLPI